MRFLQSRRHPQSGFTLIELLVIMLIIGILAAIVLPVFIKDDNTEVIKAEVCGLSSSTVLLPEGAFTLKTQVRPVPHSSYRFTVNTNDETITSFAPLAPNVKPLRC